MNCPVCKKPADPACKPFCSKRCADLDLNRWLSETYRIPIEEGPANDAEPGPETDRD
ncbi:MAG: DNA gyrase inhibitor YacG [Rhodospirillales bacterium]|nr:DNA gyrase inhibitor YacG [Rhodospirillales bacterium]